MLARDAVPVGGQEVAANLGALAATPVRLAGARRAVGERARDRRGRGGLDPARWELRLVRREAIELRVR